VTKDTAMETVVFFSSLGTLLNETPVGEIERITCHTFEIIRNLISSYFSTVFSVICDFLSRF